MPPARPISVVSLSQQPHHPALALGMVVCAAPALMRSGGGGIRLPRRVFRSVEEVSQVVEADGPAVLLFSDYIWNAAENLEASAELKRRHPECITVHGGPCVPKYADARDRYVNECPHVDVGITGEGEQTFANLLDALDGRVERRAWSDALSRVPGLFFRHGSGADDVIDTGSAERLKDVNVLPSPYLEGFFDEQGTSSWTAAILETNRGCPYGCTFCDWGSATLQKIRGFELDRVKAEIDWMAERRVPILFMADANFGIFPRDVEIAEHIVRAKERHGFPQQAVVCYAKNANDRVTEIVRIFARAGLTAQGIISLQTTDERTLAAIERRNIKTSRYEELIEAYRAEGLPISSDFLVGLPEQTLETFKNDLQFAFDRTVVPKVYPVRILPNSPMADPVYIERYAIETDSERIVRSTSTLSESDFARVAELCFAYRLGVELGIFRYLLVHLQEEHGLRALDVVERWAGELLAGRLPRAAALWRSLAPANLRSLGLIVRSATLLTHWRRFYAEFAGFLQDAYGIASSPALRSILRAQQAVMPSLGRRHPRTLRLEHDLASYLADIGIGTRHYLDPERERRVLANYGPATLDISDPARMCTTRPESRANYENRQVPFELASPLRFEGIHTHFFAPVSQGPSARVIEGLRFARSLAAAVGRGLVAR